MADNASVYSRKYSTVSDVCSGRAPSKDLTRAASRGGTRLERKSAWPFDYYQIGKFFPVDYHYYQTSVNTSTGGSRLIMMHALAYADDRSEFAADQVQHRGTMKETHKSILEAFLQTLE